jgi:glycosyltransferase involved in cell wall biosynthesis
LVHTEHGNRGDLLAGGRRRRLGRRLASLLVDRIVIVSDDLHRSMRSDLAVRAAKLRVIRNGVDAELFRPPPERDVLRRRLGFAADDLLVGTTGRLEEVKNQQLLIEAAARLVPKYPRLRIVLVGDGGRRAALEELRGRLGLERRVVFAGACDDVPAWLGVLDVFALPSHAEGTSVALLEAMAVGLPVVATRVGGSPDLVEDGACGRLTPPGDADALARALDGLLASPQLRREYGGAARARACERHTVERTVADYRTLYESLAPTPAWARPSASRPCPRPDAGR